MKVVINNNEDGFTFVDILISIAILTLFIGFYLNLYRGNHIERKKTDEINKMTMVAQGVMEAYRKVGLVGVNNNLTTLAQGYDVPIITEDVVVDMPTSDPIDQISNGLKKVTIIVNPTDSSLGINSIKLISYSS